MPVAAFGSRALVEVQKHLVGGMATGNGKVTCPHE
jgi:hypothetical protein